MPRRISLLLFLSVALSMFIFGCGGGDSPVAPVTTESHDVQNGSSSHILWGMYRITIDPETLQADIVPLRGAAFTCNVTMFMQPPVSPVHMVSLTIDPSSVPQNGYFVVDVTLRHPFPGLNKFSGFDVRGILMADGSISSEFDSSAVIAGPGDTMLLNADGYTRWWNWQEFGPHNTLFGPTHGNLAPPSQPSATINGYKYFADDLDLNEPVSALDPASRCLFAVNPGINSRRYEIQFKMDGGSPVLNFNYAIDASWAKPDQSFAPDYPLEAFPPDANCAEPYLVTITDSGSNAYYVSEYNNGGAIILDIEVFDWQAPINPSGVPGELAGLFLAGQIVSPPVNLLTSATVIDGGPTSSVFHVEIANLTLHQSGPNEIGIFALSADPLTYKPNVDFDTTPWTWPDSPLAAFMRASVNISNTQGNIVYVDDSNESGVEDGTMAHPYNTIQEGLAASNFGWEVWVDDSGGQYTGPVELVDGVVLKSVNWDISDGDSEATIAGGSPAVVGADDAAIDGFEIDAGSRGIGCDGTSPEIINCRIVGCAGSGSCGIWLYNGSHAHLNGVEVYDVRTTSNYQTCYGILIDNCDAVGYDRVVIEHTKVHFVRTTGGVLGGSYCYPHGMYINNSNGVLVRNTIVCDVTGGNYYNVYGIRILNSTDVELVNDVIYDIEKTSYYGTATGLYFTECTNLDVRNTIINRIHRSGSSQSARGVVGGSSTCTFEYNNVYDCTSSLGSGVTPGAGCFSEDPLYIDPGTDFHLAAGSPCINTGDPTILDFDSSQSDMGAYGGPGGNW